MSLKMKKVVFEGYVITGTAHLRKIKECVPLRSRGVFKSETTIDDIDGVVEDIAKNFEVDTVSVRILSRFVTTDGDDGYAEEHVVWEGQYNYNDIRRLLTDEGGVMDD